MEEEPIHDNEQAHNTSPEEQPLPKDESQSRVKEERKDEEVTPKSEPAAEEVKEEVSDQDSDSLNDGLRRSMDAFPPHDSEDSVELNTWQMSYEDWRLAAEFPPTRDSVSAA